MTTNYLRIPTHQTNNPPKTSAPLLSALPKSIIPIPTASQSVNSPITGTAVSDKNPPKFLNKKSGIYTDRDNKPIKMKPLGPYEPYYAKKPKQEIKEEVKKEIKPESVNPLKRFDFSDLLKFADSNSKSANVFLMEI